MTPSELFIRVVTPSGLSQLGLLTPARASGERFQRDLGAALVEAEEVALGGPLCSASTSAGP